MNYNYRNYSDYLEEYFDKIYELLTIKLDDNENDDGDDDGDGDDVDIQLIYQTIHSIISSLGYISKISISSNNPNELNVDIYGNTLNNTLSKLEFVVIIIKKTINVNLPYNFYIKLSSPLINITYLFGSLTINRLMEYLKYGIQKIELEHRIHFVN